MPLYFKGTLRHLYLTNPGKRPRQLLSNSISPIFRAEQRANTSDEWSLYNKYCQWINSWHFFVLVLPHLFLTNTLLCSHDFISESLREHEGEVSIMYTCWKVLSHQLGFAGLFKSSSVKMREQQSYGLDILETSFCLENSIKLRYLALSKQNCNYVLR